MTSLSLQVGGLQFDHRSGMSVILPEGFQLDERSRSAVMWYLLPRRRSYPSAPPSLWPFARFCSPASSSTMQGFTILGAMTRPMGAVVRSSIWLTSGTKVDHSFTKKRQTSLSQQHGRHTHDIEADPWSAGHCGSTRHTFWNRCFMVAPVEQAGPRRASRFQPFRHDCSTGGFLVNWWLPATQAPQARHEKGPPESHQRDCVPSRAPRHGGSLSGTDEVEGGGGRRGTCERSELGRGYNTTAVESVVSQKYFSHTQRLMPRRSWARRHLAATGDSFLRTEIRRRRSLRWCAHWSLNERERQVVYGNCK